MHESTRQQDGILFLVRDSPRCAVVLPLIAAVSWRTSLKLTLFVGWAAVSLRAASLACSNMMMSCSWPPLATALTTGSSGAGASVIDCFADKCLAEHKNIS